MPISPSMIASIISKNVKIANGFRIYKLAILSPAGDLAIMV